MSRGEQYLKWERGRYAARVASGVCITCGGVRADGDARMCQRCREKHREKCREDRRSLRGFGSSVHRHEVSAVDVGQPKRALVVCHTCYDLPWRRPHRMVYGRMAAGVCPGCGGRYAREDTRDAALLCMARESVGPWW